MREIKFRAWDKETKQFLEDISILDLLHKINGSWDDYIWTQFTGLKDKNGKEIYEGDIVIRNIYTVESGKEDMSKPFEIIWDNKKAGFEYNTNGYQNGLFHETHKVIGNIYENKELITN